VKAKFLQLRLDNHLAPDRHHEFDKKLQMD
jgi:hypothetical protein